MKAISKLKARWVAWKHTRLTAEDVQKLTLYPEVAHKKLSQIRRELYWLCSEYKRGSWTHTETITDYFNMGIDRAGVDLHQYIFRIEMHAARCSKQPITCWILRDKWVTHRYLQSCGVATTRPLLYKTPFVSAAEAIAKIKASGHTRFFAKKVDGSFGRGAFIFELADGKFILGEEQIAEDELIARMEGCIVEPYINQHEALNKLGPGGVSCIRIITFCEGGSVRVVMHYFFIPANGGYNSHTNTGAIMIGVNESGELAEEGLQLQFNRGRRQKHPETGIVFKGFKLPYWKEVYELVIKAHQQFPKIHSIGWDVAISQDGPLIIEANQHWGPHIFQYLYGPGRACKKKWFQA